MSASAPICRHQSSKRSFRSDDAPFVGRGGEFVTPPGAAAVERRIARWLKGRAAPDLRQVSSLGMGRRASRLLRSFFRTNEISLRQRNMDASTPRSIWRHRISHGQWDEAPINAPILR